ncbi:phospholipid-transporting ATPase, putative [Theileria equi strain WA]|uniref:Phospholipid-transporting ATPase, putative n=1 Tax=Theileria equi strain WA TaxID=1537102 RepID=L0AY50_THEEQ|nr:phospholipid-transporting ATPase, putative [Theileria equi strain WA]AFZ79834.1 phospholipid-transporting ATPase, putative [Theileria equi strain WA]|eukprot:XP_004829500.1 phospholipid-transporting ATPase, putative [Theileria equi strain WA]
MNNLDENVKDPDWLLSQLQKPITFKDRLNFYLMTRFNRRIYQGLRYVYIQGGSLPRIFLYNGIKNTKYNLFTFLPLILFEQFRGTGGQQGSAVGSSQHCTGKVPEFMVGTHS